MGVSVWAGECVCVCVGVYSHYNMLFNVEKESKVANDFEQA